MAYRVDSVTQLYRMEIEDDNVNIRITAIPGNEAALTKDSYRDLWNVPIMQDPVLNIVELVGFTYTQTLAGHEFHHGTDLLHHLGEFGNQFLQFTNCTFVSNRAFETLVGWVDTDRLVFVGCRFMDGGPCPKLRELKQTHPSGVVLEECNFQSQVQLGQIADISPEPCTELVIKNCAIAGNILPLSIFTYLPKTVSHLEFYHPNRSVEFVKSMLRAAMENLPDLETIYFSNPGTDINLGLRAQGEDGRPVRIMQRKEVAKYLVGTRKIEKLVSAAKRVALTQPDVKISKGTVSAFAAAAGLGKAEPTMYREREVFTSDDEDDEEV